jgi:uncharacterized membrane-anchored protein
MACCEASKLDAARARLAAVKLKERVAALGQELADVFALLVLLEGHLVGGATCKRSEIADTVCTRNSRDGVWHQLGSLKLGYTVWVSTVTAEFGFPAVLDETHSALSGAKD